MPQAWKECTMFVQNRIRFLHKPYGKLYFHSIFIWSFPQFTFFALKSCIASPRERYSIQDRIFMVEIFLKSGENTTEALRKWSSQRKNQPKPDPKTLKRVVETFRRTGNVAEDPGLRSGRTKPARTPDMIKKVEEIIGSEPNISIRRY